MKSGQKSKIYGLLPGGKRFKKLFHQKGVSAPRKLSSFSNNRKQWFKDQKHEKYFKSKNDVKKLLGAFNQELCAN